MEASLKRKTARNVGYNAAATVLIAGAQFVTNIVLARLLTPADYGIVGFANIFMAFMMQFGDFGINNAVVQRKELDEATLATAVTLKLLFSVVIFALLMVMAPLARHFMDNPALVRVIRVLSANFLVSVASFLPQVLLTRELDYRKLAIPQAVSVLAGSGVAMGMAYAGFGFWSMVANSIVTTLVAAVCLNMLRPAPAPLRFDAPAAGHLLRFGGSVFLPGIMVFLVFNTDNFVIGTLLGAEQLGYYAVAFNWGAMVCVLLAGIFHKVLFPTFSRMQHDLPALKKAYLSSVRYIAFLALPVNVLLLVYGREFLVFVLGRGTDRWLPALVSLQILCVYGLFRALLEPVGNVIVGIGKPKLCLKAILLVAVLELGLLYPATSGYGLVGVALVVLAAYVSQYLLYLPIMKRELDVHGGEFLREIRYPVYTVLLMAGIMVVTKSLVPATLATFIAQLVMATVVYLGTYRLLDGGRLWTELKALR